MKNGLWRVISLVLTLALVMGLGTVPVAAYNTPDFSDMPKNHWAYDSVMKMADAGVIKGTGNGAFSPEATLSAEMFITLVGRVVFPGVTAEGTDWSGPYIAEAKAKGLLTGTAITDANLKGGISRYDMAVILAKSAELLKVTATKGEASKIADYGDIPTKYVDAVLMAYGSGLLQGDDLGNFNGQNTMTRKEAATVMDRVIKLKDQTAGGTTTEPGKDDDQTTTPEPLFAWASRYAPVSTYDPSNVELVQGEWLNIDWSFYEEGVSGGIVYLRPGETLQLAVCEVPAGYGYTAKDVTWTSDHDQVATVDENGLITALKPGFACIEGTVPVIYYKEQWTVKSVSIDVYIDP